MKIHQCKQGSPEWLQLRAGIPCSSEFHRIVTATGKPSSQQEAYKFQLLAERILGRPLVEHVSWAMERGSTLEKKAVEYFEFQTDTPTQEIGFITNDEETWGTSPDRLVSETDLLEVKCPDVPKHMMNLMSVRAAMKEYFIQIQGGLWITARRATWLLSYHPDLPFALYQVGRDVDFIKILDTEVRQFSDDLERLSAIAKDRGYFRLNSIREPKESLQEQQVRLLKESLASLK